MKFDKTKNLLNGLTTICEFYFKKFDELPISEQIGIILYKNFLKENNLKFIKLELEENFFKEEAFKIDEIYSGCVLNMNYKDGTENKNTIYSMMFNLIMEIDDVFQTKREENDSSES